MSKRPRRGVQQRAHLRTLLLSHAHNGCAMLCQASRTPPQIGHGASQLHIYPVSCAKTIMNLPTTPSLTHQPHPERTTGMKMDTDNRLSGRDETRPTVTSCHDTCPSPPYRRCNRKDPSTLMTTGHPSITGSPTRDATLTTGCRLTQRRWKDFSRVARFSPPTIAAFRKRTS